MAPLTEEQITTELAEAEAALAASHRALRTHGHQAITWQLLRYDAKRVNELRATLAKAEGLRDR